MAPSLHSTAVLASAAIFLLLQGPALPPVTGPGPAAARAGAIAARADAAAAAMQATYDPDGDGAYRADSGGPQAASLWADSWALAALEDVASLPGGARFIALVRRAADGLQVYWDPGAEPPAYAPTPHPAAGDTKYVDDNAWVGLDLLSAWRLTGDAAYLAQAEAVMRYAEAAWDPDGGGLWWSDAREDRNTAANAATAELAARLYLATGDRSDLAWAERIYAWERDTLIGSDGRVADGMGSGDQWTYNYGVVVAAGVALFQATGTPGYLAESERVAGYALQHLRQADGAFLPQSRFAGVLADGLLALLHVDQDPRLAAALALNADLAWSRAQSGAGLFGEDWTGPPPRGDVPLLTDTGAVRVLAAAAASAR